MKERLFTGTQSETWIHRDDSDESGKYYFNEIIHDEHILKRNARIRLESLMTPGQKVPLLGQGEPGEIVHCFSIPVEHWALLKRDYPDIVAGLTDKDPDIAMQAARRLEILHPEWALMAGNR